MRARAELLSLTNRPSSARPPSSGVARRSRGHAVLGLLSAHSGGYLESLSISWSRHEDETTRRPRPRIRTGESVQKVTDSRQAQPTLPAPAAGLPGRCPEGRAT